MDLLAVDLLVVVLLAGESFATDLLANEFITTDLLAAKILIADLLSDELSTVPISNRRKICKKKLLSGGRHDIDVDDLRINTKYTGGYSYSSRTVKLFWEVTIQFVLS
ncbi:uncharacterized protein LOC109717106 [Ananas comosus]|uniref:HECT-type E3 ubiquitin transferase n=1 Tax=Ananas comosus TaxID=4615 RepID=A0A6P5FZF5_ANACO|nr:uncharacterized protein LOC109717106 [Ananas comosus]